MLVLTRKKNEKIVISHGDVMIEVTVMEIRDGRVRLGLLAPPDVKICRHEVQERFSRPNEAEKPVDANEGR